MSEQPTWEDWVNKLKRTSEFDSNFELARHFKELRLYTEHRDLLRSEFKKETAALIELKKNVTKEIRTIEKALKLPLHDQEVVTVMENTIKKHSDDISRNIQIAQRYSKSKMYISRLCGIFYKGTGKIPVIKSHRKVAYGSDEYNRYSGIFYDFLFEAKELLKEIGIELPEYETLGRYAYEIVNGDKKKGILSFQQSIKEIENESKEIEKILIELNNTN